MDAIHGNDGADGLNGVDGNDGANGLSAYELAVQEGFEGTLEEWLESLVGEDGAPALPLYTSLTASFNVPSLNTSTTIQVGSSALMVVGAWLHIEKAGHFRIANVANPTSVQITNIGSVFGWPNGVALNEPPGTTIMPNGLNTQVMHCAVPGLPGDDGTEGPVGPVGPSGMSAQLPVLSVAPTDPPAGPHLATVIFANPVTGISQLLGWNGAAWVVQATLTGAPGTQILFGTGDPQTAAPSAPIGTLFWDTATGVVSQKQAPTLWAVMSNPYAPLFNLGENEVVHDTAGPLSVPLSLPFTRVLVSDDIELDHSAIPFNAEWIVELRGVSGGNDLTFAAGKWAVVSDMLPAIPEKVLPGNVVQLKFRRMQVSTGVTRMVIVEVVDTASEVDLLPLGS